MKHLLLILLACLFIVQAHTQNILNYDWKNVKIGGGGYITGIKVHPQDPDIMYLRTDVGGAYRWNAGTQEVEQIINFREGNYYGVAGIALHPTDKDIVYLAVDEKNIASNAAILKSTDRGSTWEVIPTDNFKFGANGGRTNSDTDDRDREGSPIAVNPNDVNELWVGSREKGLWRLNGTSWTRIAAGTMPDNNLENSIRNVLFHPTNLNYIYVGYYNYGIYRSSNGGTSFSQINGGNNDLKDVSDLSFSKDATKLYAACRNKGVFRLDNPTTNTNWTNTNIGDANIDYGYLAVTASLHDDDIVVACPAGKGGNNFERLHVSYDGGNNWTKKNNITTTTIFNWNQGNSQGQHNSQIAFDPNDPNKLYFTSWSGLWHTANWQANQVAWRNDMARGHEEIVNTGLVAFPPNNNGTLLGVNSADHAGWIITDPDNYPMQDIKDLTTPDASNLIKGAGTAICERYPANIAISSTRRWNEDNEAVEGPSQGYILSSTNAGQSFTKVSGYATTWGKANIAIAESNPNNIVVVCEAGVKYSGDKGVTFDNASGISGVSAENNVFFPHRPLVADAVANNTFYIYRRSDGSVFRSTNQGQNWSLQGSVPFTLSNESNLTRLTAVPDREGHLWINHHNNGLYRSMNGGSTWTQISNVSKAIAISIGKEKTAGGYPTIYMFGQLSNQSESWFYRSTDEGATWEQINDASTLFLGANIRHIAADRSEFGKIYVSVSGMGVWSGSEQNSPALFMNITAPTQGESIQKGSTYNITWNDNLPDDVRVVLFKDGNYYDTIESSVPSNGTYAWTVANDIPAGNNYQIRVRGNVNLDIDDYSENFSIIDACPAAGAACNDGDVCTVNDVYDNACNCTGTYTDADGDGYCIGNDPNDNDPCNPDTCTPAGCELVQNGGFTNGTTDWTLYKFGSADGNLSITGNGYAKIDVINPGTSNWHLSLRQTGFLLENGKTYYLRVRAYADAPRSSPIIMGKSNGTQYAYISQSLTTTPTFYEYQFTMNDVTDTNAYLNLTVGNNPTTVYIDDVSISEIQAGTTCDDGDACTINDVYDNACNCAGTYTDADGDGYCAANDPDDNDPCNPDDCDLGDCELIQNWNFDNGTADWTMYQYGSATGNLSVLGNGDVKIDVINPGTSNWHLSLRQTGLTIENGKTYQVKVLAYADAARSCPIIVSKSNGTQYAYITQSLTTTPTVYEYQFTMNDVTDTNAYFQFTVGNDLTDVYVSEVSLSEVGCVPSASPSCPTVENLTGNTTTNATHHAAQTISSDATINADVIYKAGDEVELKSGFSTNPANNFSGEIEDCGGN